ncbi:MAG: tRNA (adenosine(37)-N6)-dimethylallyltransferase MiaA [Paludibacteraceae bacterium]|nr:tRNA (adenosine(37)-N6)-dimethylallyltransferase MiaA [Bacteroidales bacterium]MBO5132746.1 tRNA (adenosine(37)-N6)-dimethylallyltransferase MiaA [Paludibacteraceae bacterium]MBQ9100557.1 tRNA (adenosine(37)-N6)-dimethylallyltransferase MiaA [Paludibacteraceae bacterium]
MKEKKLIILLGPTGVGKTELSLQMAEELGTEIISCDSRQMYREMKIGTAAPTEEELKRVPHHFIGHLSIHDYYSCGRFEIDALAKCNELFQSHDTVIMTGGSMLYIDAVCKGIDDIPNIDEELRQSLLERYQNEGIENIRQELKILDPDYYKIVDLQNHKRIIHALEVCIQSGKPYSSFRSESVKKRPFTIEKIGLNRPREVLYDRINKRVDIMMENGLLEEAKSLYPFKGLNALNTVGYKELFNYFDGIWTLDFAIQMIKQNSRRYAKKQLTWFNRDSEITWRLL